MADIEMIEVAASESSHLKDREQSAVIQMEDTVSMASADILDGAEIDTDGNTRLHRAVLSICQSSDKKGLNNYHHIDKLMREQTHVNMPNKKGYTVIGSAIEYRYKKCVKHLLQHPSASRLHLDYYPGDRECTVREIIVETYPELQPLLPEPLMESLHSSERHLKLLAALQHDDYDMFRENLELNNPNPSYDEPYHSTLLEIACQMKNRKKYVKFLLDKDADPNTVNNFTDMPLIHATARSGNFEVLKVLLKNQETNITLKDKEGRTILHWLARVSEKKPGDKERIENCLERVLTSAQILDTDCEDSDGNTPLYFAVKNEFLDRVILLLRKGADITLSIHGTPIISSVSTPLLEAILEDGLESNDEQERSEDFKLTFRNKYLEKIMSYMAENPHQKDSLKHPVTSCFLSLPYNQISFILYDTIPYIFLLILTTCFILLPWYKLSVMHVIIFIFWALILVYRTVKCVCNCAPSYLLTLDIPMITYFYVKIFSFENSSLIWPHIKAIAILLAWLKLVLVSGRLPMFAVQTEMLKAVSLTFFRYMIGYSILLTAFALTFFVIFEESSKTDENNMFGDPFLSIIKTTVMFAGEFEASNLSFDALPFTSHVIFLIFVLLVSTVLMNLMSGLAVGDTKEIRDHAETLSLVAIVKLNQKMESFSSAFPKFMTPIKLTRASVELYPNRPHSIKPTTIRSLVLIITKRREPSKKRKSITRQEEWNFLSERLNTLERQIRTITEGTRENAGI